MVLGDLGVVKDQARKTARRAAVSIGLGLLAFILALVGLGFLAAGFFMALSISLGPVAAAFITGGGALVFAILVALLASRPGTVTPRHSAAKARVTRGVAPYSLPTLLVTGFLSGFLSGHRPKNDGS